MSNFFAELKRRNVYKVAVAYAVVAWLLFQAASILLPTFEAPSWVMKAFTVFLALGFVFAVFISWAFEMTPQGMKRTADVSADEVRSFPYWSKRKFAAFIAGVAIIATGLLAYQFLRTPRSTTAVTADSKSIAVLPFVNMSADKNDEYLSDGVSEELITALSKITGLQVKARTSSFVFKGKNEDIQKIGELLHVSHLLEGSVAKAGNKLRITAQLIQASDGNHEWSDTYDREMQDIFAVRSEVAEKVAETLKVRLLGEEKRKIDKKPTENLEAYNLYRQGRFYGDQVSEEGIKKALPFFEQAIQKDPRFALAYAGMADTYVAAADAFIAPREAFSKAKEAAQKAIELDDTLAEAHASLGLLHYHYDWDWAAAEKEFKRALILNPQSAWSYALYSQFLGGMGRVEEANEQGRHALELDPLSVTARWCLGWAFLSAGRSDEAIEELSKAMELEPTSAWARTFLGRAYLSKGMQQRAIEELETARRDGPDDVFVLSLLGYGYAVTGRRADALEVLQRFDEMEKHRYVSRAARVYVYAGLGDKDKAFEWLEKAYQERSDALAWFRQEPESKSLRSDPRFAVLMRKIGFADAK
ncbi:MAG TPA: tetratricopeptide repeat protein [Chthoniobacterales bacterium]|nr:tetratricopeptide repeat protein [Chthoniobacterales bacterium]